MYQIYKKTYLSAAFFSFSIGFLHTFSQRIVFASFFSKSSVHLVAVLSLVPSAITVFLFLFLFIYIIGILII